MDTVPEKRCTKCGDTKAAAAFAFCKRNNDGLQYICKSCSAAYAAANRDRIAARMRVYQAEHRDEMLVSGAAYRAAHREEANAYRRTYHAEHRDADLARVAAWRAANRERHGDQPSAVGDKRCARCSELKPPREFSVCRTTGDGLQVHCKSCKSEINKAHRAANRDRILAKEQAWREEHREQERSRLHAHREAHREEHNAANRAYKHANPEKVNANTQLRYARKKGAEILGPVDYDEIKRRDGGRCWICGKSIKDGEASEFDHAVAITRGGEHSTRNIRQSHATCNRKKSAKDITHQRFLL